jgi:predicted RNA binding protein YcfA (HicA-like mRNA interferase family)
VKRLSCSEMMRLLERHGWSVVRRGKHPIYGKPGVAGIIPVPDYGNKTLAPGTQKSIMRAAGLTDDDL